MRPLLSITFPQGIRTSGSGGKKTFKMYLKRKHTDRQTHRQTHIWTDADALKIQDKGKSTSLQVFTKEPLFIVILYVVIAFSYRSEAMRVVIK